MASEKDGEDKLLSLETAEDDIQEDEDADDEVEEAAEFLMTDMTLDDTMEKIRDTDPGPTWVYHIEMYPWHADDINERFIRLLKLASFSNLSQRKKPISHEMEDPERQVDKVMERQRKGTLHLYTESHKTARAILRHATWSNMVSKEITFEITKRNPDTGNVVTARMDVDTVSMSKVKFRNKTKGTFKARSARVSNIPEELTRDIIEIVFCRSNVAYNGPETEPHKENEVVNPQQTVAELARFRGSVDVDCLTRGSCRSLVLAMKSVSVMGHDLSIAANDSQTMIVPPESQTIALKPKEDFQTKQADVGNASHGVQAMSAGRGRGSLTRINSPVSHMVQSARINPLVQQGRPRGIGVARGMVALQQPASASFTRSGQSMPVPMTGRQKMNEKMRRNHPNVVMGAPSTGVYQPVAASAGYRAANMKSIGDSFKQEIASLQSELEWSTQAIEAKIERLKEESHYYSGYNEEMQMYVEGDWDQQHKYEYEVDPEEYYNQDYNLYTHNTLGYELPYEQQMEPVILSSRGAPRRGGSRGRGGGGGSGMVHQIPAQRQTGLMGTSQINSARNTPPPHPHPHPMRSMRGSGGGVVYHRPGATGGYW